MPPLRVFLILFCIISINALSACGTARGVGQDLEAAGRAVQDIVD